MHIYYCWSPLKYFSLLGDTKVGAGKVVLQPRGFALPHNADSNKIAYVVEGIFTCMMHVFFTK